MTFLIKLNLLFFGLGLCSAFLCLYHDRISLGRYESKSGFSQDFFDSVYLTALKAFTFFYYSSIFLIAVSTVLLSILIIPAVMSLPTELTIGLLVIMTVMSLSALFTLPVIIKNYSQDKYYYISITPGTEPELCDLANELAYQFEMLPIEDIRITPGTEIQITEDANTLDDVFYGGSKRIEIGLSSLQFLTSDDLKVLLARQFALYEKGDQILDIVIGRMNRKMKLVRENLAEAGFFYVLNPVYWFSYLGSLSVPFITRDYLTLTEMKADSAAVEYTGIKRLKSALVRLNVETEHHREIIESAKLHRVIGQENLDNIYNVLKRSYRLPDETAGGMSEFIFTVYLLALSVESICHSYSISSGLSCMLPMTSISLSNLSW